MKCARDALACNLMCRGPDNTLSPELDVPCGWWINARNEVQISRLSRSIGADQTEHFSTAHVGVQAFDGDEPAESDG